MQFEITDQRAKTIARAIQKRCKAADTQIAYGQALDGLAEGLGLRDWNTLAAKLAASPCGATPEAAGAPTTEETAPTETSPTETSPTQTSSAQTGPEPAPQPQKARAQVVEEAIADSLDGAARAVAAYLSAPTPNQAGAIPMKVFVAETLRSYPARGYVFEGPDGTLHPIGGVKLPDGIAFDGVVEFRTSRTDWTYAEIDLETEMEAQGYTPYGD